MSNYTRGRDIEYKVTHLLEGQGYLAQRAASSKGNWDVYAVSPSGILLVSCKRAKDLKSARSTYVSEKKKLMTLAGKVPNGARQGLYIWIDKAPGKLGGEWYAQEIITPRPEESVDPQEESTVYPDALAEASKVKEELHELNMEFLTVREAALDAVRDCYNDLKIVSDKIDTKALLQLTEDVAIELKKVYDITLQRKVLTDRYRDLKDEADAIAKVNAELAAQEFEGEEIEPEF